MIRFKGRALQPLVWPRGQHYHVTLRFEDLCHMLHDALPRNTALIDTVE